MRQYITNPGEGVWKFVRVSGQYRFVDGENVYAAHADLVAKGETPETAGIIGIYREGWRVYSHWSMTLKKGMDGDDEKLLTALLNRPMLSRY